MQLFQVKSPDGELIMNAPLETIANVWRLNTVVKAHILKHTAKLDAEYVIHFAAEHGGWPKTLRIQRLPLEIPSGRALTATDVMKMQQQQTVVEQRRDAALAAWNEQIPESMRVQALTTETELGRLLCDE